jgi:hypothetical protein
MYGEPPRPGERDLPVYIGAGSLTELNPSIYVGAPLLGAKPMFHKEFWDSIVRIPSKNGEDELRADISLTMCNLPDRTNLPGRKFSPSFLTHFGTYPHPHLMLFAFVMVVVAKLSRFIRRKGYSMCK